MNSVADVNSVSAMNSLFSPKNKSMGRFQFEDISVEFVCDELKKLKSSKAVGLDKLPARLLKDCAEVISRPLTTLLNISLSEGNVLREWKSPGVIPLFKGGKLEDMDNYRPISILPVVSKVLERAVHTQLHGFLDKGKFLSPYQFGFRRGHSTESAVISFTDAIRRNMDQGILTGAVFIDIWNAFDTIDHVLQLKKLCAYGIEGDELDWFKDY